MVNPVKKGGRPPAEQILGLGYIESTKTFLIDDKLIEEAALPEKDVVEMKKKAKKLSFITE